MHSIAGERVAIGRPLFRHCEYQQSYPKDCEPRQWWSHCFLCWDLIDRAFFDALAFDTEASRPREKRQRERQKWLIQLSFDVSHIFHHKKCRLKRKLADISYLSIFGGGSSCIIRASLLDFGHFNQVLNVHNRLCIVNGSVCDIFNGQLSIKWARRIFCLDNPRFFRRAPVLIGLGGLTAGAFWFSFLQFQASFVDLGVRFQGSDIGINAELLTWCQLNDSNGITINRLLELVHHLRELGVCSTAEKYLKNWFLYAFLKKVNY